MESILTFRALGLYRFGCMRNPLACLGCSGSFGDFWVWMLDTGYLILDAKDIGLELDLGMEEKWVI